MTGHNGRRANGASSNQQFGGIDKTMSEIKGKLDALKISSQIENNQK